MRLFLKIFLLFSAYNSFSQNSEAVLSSVKIDSLYREDQFYFGFTLNSLQNKPIGLAQDKFSPGFSFGFLRDMPLNKKRTIAIAPGLGFAITSYNQNLAVTLNGGTPVYTLITTGYSVNRFTQYLVEVPIEFRWRSSTFESHKFWRIHGGFKLGYLLYDNSVYESSNNTIDVYKNKDFNRIQYGAYLSTGYNCILYSITIIASVGTEEAFLEKNQ
jgi:hypothetical protein